jgi:hypothetical protein
MAVRLSSLRAGRPLYPWRFLVLISVRVWANPTVTVWPEELGQLKNPVTSWTKLAATQPVAQCHNQLGHPVHCTFHSWHLKYSDRTRRYYPVASKLHVIYLLRGGGVVVLCLSGNFALLRALSRETFSQYLKVTTVGILKVNKKSKALPSPWSHMGKWMCKFTFHWHV